MDKTTELKNNIVILKAKLRATDYNAIKFAEGELSAAEFAPIKEQRKAWRTEINALETMLARTQGNG